MEQWPHEPSQAHSWQRAPTAHSTHHHGGHGEGVLPPRVLCGEVRHLPGQQQRHIRHAAPHRMQVQLRHRVHVRGAATAHAGKYQLVVVCGEKSLLVTRTKLTRAKAALCPHVTGIPAVSGAWLKA